MKSLPHALTEPNELVDVDEGALADHNKLEPLEDSDEALGADDGEPIARKADSTCRLHCDGPSSSWRCRRSSLQ